MIRRLPTKQVQRKPNLQRMFFLIAGFFFVALGVVGALLPVMPTTIFIILAAGCFARSSPRLEAWLLDHRVFGPTLKRWRERGAIPPAAKAMACTGMAVGFLVFFLGAHPSLPLALVVAAALLGCAGYVVSRPSA